MGNSVGSESQDDMSYDESKHQHHAVITSQDYLKLIANLVDTKQKTGGSPTIMGGYSSLEAYGNSMFSNAKGALIRSIAKDVASVLKISSSFAETADLKDIIEKFEKVVPNPRQGRKIKVDKKIHIDVCKKFASAINKTYKMKIINLDDSAENMCQAVSELLYSLFTGLHSEFITVAGDITRIMSNLNALQDYVDGVNNKLIKDLEECSPGEASLIKESYEALSREIHRQHAYLANLSSSVVGPVGSSLIKLLEENKSMSGLTDDLKAITGSREFSDKLSNMLTGTSTVAHAAYLVDKALKQIGMSVPEYKKTKNIKELRSAIYEKLVKSKPNSKQMNKLLIAADILYRNDLSHENIADYLSKTQKTGKLGGNGMNFAQLVSDSLYQDTSSVFKGRRHADKHSIGRSINNRDSYREKLFSALNQQIQDCYNQIITELYKIGKKIGGEIKVTDTLRSFIRQLGYFSGVQPDQKDLHKALSGYRTDVNSEYIKHDFLKSLETLKDAADSAASGNNPNFKSVSAAVHQLIKVIDDFNTTFTKTLTEVHVENDRKYDDNMSKGTVGGYNDYESDDDEVAGGTDADFKYLVTMKKAIREIEYYYKIANIKENLKIASMQHESYTKDYENILGEECGMMIDMINAKYKSLTCEDETYLGTLKGSTSNTASMCQVKANFKTDLNTPGKPDIYKPYWEAYTFMLEYIRSAKVDMIEAAQALDLYLSKFTTQIQSNPDDIKDFVKLLEQIEIVAKWFTDKSGDNLTNVFESFNDPDDHDGLSKITDKNLQPAPYGTHYYKSLNEKTTYNKPGDWTRGIVLTSRNIAKEFVMRMEKSIKSMRALENIISIFSKLSNKSSGDEINTFMSPGLIFKAFMKYTVATSIAMGHNEISDKSTDLHPDYKLWLTAKVTGSTGTKIIVVKNATTAAIINTVYLRPVNSEWLLKHYYDPLELDSDYMKTDDIFEMSIKSMISKVFTVVGSYSLFQRPAKDFINNKALANTSLRQIMGGGVTVKIIPDAVELYIRLTLLGEWYRELFQFKKPEPADTIIVSMIPSFDGIWADFVKVIFVDAANINDGGYTDSFTQDLISSINTIYTHYKSKYGSDACTKILENFVAEVNLRYGLMLQEDIKKYLNTKDEGLKDNTYDETDDNVDYDILDAKDQFSRKSAPSDKFIKESYKSNRLSTIANKHFTKEIKKFRENVEKALKLENIKDSSTGSSFGKLGLEYSSVDDLVNQTVKRIKATDSDDKKYKIVQSTILGIEKYSNVDYDCMLMFHETVINPLTIIYTVYKMINHFNKFANSLNFKTDPSTIIADDIKQCATNLTTLLGDSKYKESKHLYFTTAEYDRYKNTGNATINFNNLVEDTINHLMYLTCDKNPMVEMYFSGDGTNRYPMLSFKNLEKYVIELLENVGESLNKLRKVIPHDVVARYENNEQKDFKMKGTSPTNPNVISLFYLKEHFVDRLIKNKYGGGLSDANIALKSIWTMATTQDASGAGKFVSTNKTHGPYNSLIAKLVYWDSLTAGNYTFKPRTIRYSTGTGANDKWTKFPINKIGITKMSAVAESRIPKDVYSVLLSPTFNKASITNYPSEIYRDMPANAEEYRGSFGFKGIYDYDADSTGYGIKYNDDGSVEPNGKEGAYGLLFKLNRLIYHYVNLFTDRTSNKIYLPLLEKFANGINAREIMKGEAIDDITRADDAGGPLGNALFPTHEIDSKSVLFATLARAIRNIVNDKKAGVTSVSILMNAESNLLNISEYMKDIMTAYLPIFEKQLNIMVNQAELIKSLIENTRLKVAGTAPGADESLSYNGVKASQVNTDGVALTLKKPNMAAIEADSKGHFITLLSSIIATSKSLQSCVKGVYKELADIPLYFETYQNSITDYKNRNGVLPLMPLSQVSHLLNNQHRLVSGEDRPNSADINANKFGGATMVEIDKTIAILANTTPNTDESPAVIKVLQTIVDTNDSLIPSNISVLPAAINKINDYITKAKFINDYGSFFQELNDKVLVADNEVAKEKISNDPELIKVNAIPSAQLIRIISELPQLDDFVLNVINDDVLAAINNTDVPKFSTAIQKKINTVKDTVSGVIAATAATPNGGQDSANKKKLAAANTTSKKLNIATKKSEDAKKAVAEAPNTKTAYESAIKSYRTELLSYIKSIRPSGTIKRESKATATKAKTDRATLLNALAETDAPKLSKDLTDLKKLISDQTDPTNAIDTNAKFVAIKTAVDDIKTTKTTAVETLLTKVITDIKSYKPDTSDVDLADAKLTLLQTAFDEIKTAIGAVANAFAGSGILENAADAYVAATDNAAKTAAKTALETEITAAVKLIEAADTEFGNTLALLTPILAALKSLNHTKRYKYYSCKGLIPHQDVGVGSDEFKFAYGTRGLLSDNNEPNVEMAPGVLGVLDIYNSKMGGAASYDKRKMVDSFVNSTHLLRFATDYIYHKTYLCNNDLDKLTEFYLVGVAATNGKSLTTDSPNVNILQHLSCQTGRHSFNDTNVVDKGLIAANNEFFRVTSNITLLTENDNYKQSVYRMLSCIVSSNIPEHMQNQSRSQLRIYNILDSNIVPINFHALQREIALINIFNYSYTFDQMIKEFIGVETASRTLDEISLTDDADVDEPVSTGSTSQKIGIYPEDALVRILIKPQGKRYIRDYVNNIWKLMAGNDSLTLNRPKYLSDQLWNKVLLNSLYGDASEAKKSTTIGLVPNDRLSVGHLGSQLARTMHMGEKQGLKINNGKESIDTPTDPVTYSLDFGNAKMTYEDSSNKSKPKSNKHSINVETAGSLDAKICNGIGYERYQTIIVRYIEWFVHLQRVMRLLMRDQLTWVNDPIVHQSNALNDQITEYASNNKFDISDFE